MNLRHGLLNKAALFLTTLFVGMSMLAAPTEVLARDRRKSGLEENAQCVARKVASSLHQPVGAREQFIQENLNTQQGTVEKNISHIERSEHSQPGSDDVFAIFENKDLKKWNKLFPKELATSISNRFKTILDGKIKALETKYPSVADMIAYDDYKARATVNKIAPLERDAFLGDLTAAFQASKKELKLELLDKNIVRLGDIDSAFKAGSGDTADRAGIAARIARELPGDGRIVDYSEPWVQKTLTDRLALIEHTRQTLQNSMSRKIPFTQDGTPTAQVFDLIRKFPDSNTLLIKLEKTFNTTFIKVDEVKLLKDYADYVDTFSPALRIPKREIISLDHADHGGVTLDFLGMGSSNQSAVSKAIAGISDPDHAIIASRKAEKEVTSQFLQKILAFRDVLGEDITACSGDDCAAVPTRPFTSAEKQAMVKSLASNPLTREVRMSFIPEGVPRSERTALSTHGEEIEKALRANLLGKLSAPRIANITFAIDMQGTRLGDGLVDVITGTAAEPPLSPAERKTIQLSLVEAVRQTNADLFKNGFKGHYKAIKKGIQNFSSLK